MSTNKKLFAIALVCVLFVIFVGPALLHKNQNGKGEQGDAIQKLIQIMTAARGLDYYTVSNEIGEGLVIIRRTIFSSVQKNNTINTTIANNWEKESINWLKHYPVTGWTQEIKTYRIPVRYGFACIIECVYQRQSK